jgi:DNA-binding response OmpR family regulator
MPLVVLTAHRDEDVRHVLSELGIEGILHKPLKPAELEEIITRLLPG